MRSFQPLKICYVFFTSGCVPVEPNLCTRPSPCCRKDSASLPSLLPEPGQLPQPGENHQESRCGNPASVRLLWCNYVESTVSDFLLTSVFSSLWNLCQFTKHKGIVVNRMSYSLSVSWRLNLAKLVIGVSPLTGKKYIMCHNIIMWKRFSFF